MQAIFSGDCFNWPANAEWLEDEITTTGAVDVIGANVDVNYLSKNTGITINNITGVKKSRNQGSLLTRIL